MHTVKPIKEHRLYFYKIEKIAISIVVLIALLLIPGSYSAYVDGNIDGALIALLLFILMPLWIYQLIIKSAFIRREFRMKIDYYEVDTLNQIVFEYSNGRVHRKYTYKGKHMNTECEHEGIADIVMRGNTMDFLENANASMFQRPEFEVNTALFIMYGIPNANGVLKTLLLQDQDSYT